MTYSLAMMVHYLLCSLMFYGAFCRAVHTNHRTAIAWRIIINSAGSVAAFGMVAPISFGLSPNVFELMLLGLIVMVQYVTSHFWRVRIREILKRAQHGTHAV